MNAEEHDALIADYVLHRSSDQDRHLRELLDQVCPDCSASIREVETSLAPLALDLAPQRPPPALRKRVLDRIAAEKPAGPPAPTAPSPALNPDGPGRTPVPAARRSRAWITVAAPLVAVLAVVLWGELRLRGQLTDQDQLLQTIRSEQGGTREQVDDVVVRLQRTRSLAEGLRERENQIAVLERRLRDLERVSILDSQAKDLELAALREQIDIVRSERLTVHDLAGQADSRGTLRLFFDHAGHRWMIAGEGLPPAGADRCYELWMVTADGRTLASETFQPDAEGRVRMMVDVPATMDMAAAAITDEPLGGVAVATGEIRYLAKLR